MSLRGADVCPCQARMYFVLEVVALVEGTARARTLGAVPLLSRFVCQEVPRQSRGASRL